jgi:hypothetical protein
MVTFTMCFPFCWVKPVGGGHSHDAVQWSSSFGDIPKMLGCLLLGPILCDFLHPVDLCYPKYLFFLRLVNFDPVFLCGKFFHMGDKIK